MKIQDLKDRQFYFNYLKKYKFYFQYSDDTYMYDEDARCGGGLGLGPGGQHWYDEPPYESDPEDFLMGASGGPVPTATIQNGR